MIGSTFATVDMSATWGGVADLPDATSHVTTLQLRNNDNFGSSYGYKGTDYDYEVLLRNTRESPKAGSPLITRHNAEFRLTKRATISSGIVTPAIPYVVGVTLRFPETGSVSVINALAGQLFGALGVSQGAKILKLLNFES